MMGTVFLHQLHDNLRSLRFQVSLGILLLFFVTNGVIYTMKIQRSGNQYARVMSLDEERIARAETLGQVVGQWIKIRSPDTGIEFIAEAGSFWFEYARWLSPESGNTMYASSSRTTNAWMRQFEVLDWTVIVRYILSFLCIVLAYNAISGELESGALRLALANSVPRAHYLLGKFFGHLVTLMVATVVGSLLSLLILVINQALQVDAALARGYLLFLLGVVCYVSLFLLLGLGVSVVARTSATSLVFLITAWTLLVVVLPQTSYLIARHATERIDSDEDRVYERQYREALEREGIGIRPHELAGADNYTMERRYAERMAEMGAQKDRFRRDVERRQLRQYGLARQVNVLSPGFAFQYAVEAFLSTGILRYESFSKQAWEYRTTLRDFLRARDATDADSPQIPFLRDFMSQRPIDASDIPRFKEKAVPFRQGLAAGILPFSILLIETIAALFFALTAFNRADLTG
jgi:hypothetical protein